MSGLTLVEVVLVAICFSKSIKGDEGCGRGWVAFEEEKCYRLVQESATWDDAYEICSGERNASLAMIKTEEEENFLEDYLFNQKKVLDNVWIGGFRSNNNSTFRWTDGSAFDYQHWKEGEPNDRETKNCVQMIGNEDLIPRGSESSVAWQPKMSKIGVARQPGMSEIGLWSNTECTRHLFNLVCEKPQEITFDRLSQIVFSLKNKYKKEKKELKDTIAEMQTVESDLRSTIEEIQTSEGAYVKRLAALEEEIAVKVINVRAPINSVYIQYPLEVPPSQLWNCSHSGVWKDVSGDYAGLFFRVYGGNATSWGAIQEEEAPRLTEFYLSQCGDLGTSCSDNDIAKSVPLKGYSEEIYINHNYDANLRFKNGGVEVRPRNMAVKVWKCVASPAAARMYM